MSLTTRDEHKERFCMTHGDWCHDTGTFVRVVKILKGGKKNVRLECPNCARKRKERKENTRCSAT